MSERSAEDRERARLEREARRASKGKAPQRPVEPPQATAPAQPPEPPPEPPPPYEAPPEPLPRDVKRGFTAGGLAPRRGRLVLGAIAGVLVLVLTWFLLSTFQPFKGEGAGEVQVTIPEGASAGQIADILEEREVISSSFFFRLRLALSGGGGDLKPGSFTLAEGMGNAEAIEAISAAPESDVITLTVPEGLSRAETERLLGSSLRGDYGAASRRSRLLDPRRYGARGATSLEGFLFPATYELERGATAKALVDNQLEAFKRESAKVDLRYARSKNLTPYDVLTIASMVEREAQLARERPLVAAVIYNRLSDGMHLGIDATIRFATDNWTEPLTQSELAIDSPYNTRTRPGLPPGPIGSPGLAAMRAAARPARTDHLYYVVKPGTCGEHAFSATDAEFQRDVEIYNSERAARGGKSPTDC